MLPGMTITDIPDGKSVIEIMDPTGDTKLIWDASSDDEVDNARRTFDDLKGKGFIAYSVKGKRGEKGEVLQAFDPDAERIIMAPPMQGG